MAGIIKVDQVQSDSNLAFNIAGSNVAFMNATSLQMVGSNVSLAGTNVITNGKLVTAGMPVGAVLQVVQTQKTDTFSSQSQSFVDITGLSVSITPTSATSKILVCMNVMLGGAAHHDLKIVRGSTDIAIGDAAGNRVRGTSHMYRGFTGGNYDISPASMMWLDSPATTLSTTYKLQVASPYNASYIAYINRVATDDDNSYNGRGVSTITVMEIAA
jgi:hypothetical protein